MKQILTSIRKKIKPTLSVLKSMAMNDDGMSAMSEETYSLVYEMIGSLYVMISKLEIIEKNVDRIVECCKAEINGTFYNQYLKEFEGIDCACTYTTDTIYQWILSYWDQYPKPEIGDDIKLVVEHYSSMHNTLSEGLLKFFPNLQPFKQMPGGEIKPTNLTEIQIGEALKAGSLELSIDLFNERLKEVKLIAEQRGNIGTIIQLLTL